MRLKNFTKTPLAQCIVLAMAAPLVTVPPLYQVNGKTVPSGESQVVIDKNGVTYEAENPKHCGYALAFVNTFHVPFNKRRQNKGRETIINIHILLCRPKFLSLMYVYVVLFNLVCCIMSTFFTM